jgi:hypothetical protein
MEEMRIVKGVGEFTGIFALGEFPHRGGTGTSRSRIRGFERDGRFQKAGCLQLSICLSFHSPQFFLLSHRFHDGFPTGSFHLPCFCMQRKTLIYSVSEYISVFLSVMTFYYAEFTTYWYSCKLNTSVQPGGF